MVKRFDKSEQIALLEMLEVSRLLVNAILRRANYSELEQLAQEWIAFRNIIDDREWS